MTTTHNTPWSIGIQGPPQGPASIPCGLPIAHEGGSGGGGGPWSKIIIQK